MKFEGIIIDKVNEVRMWKRVPTYEKLNFTYCTKCLFRCLIGSFEAKNALKYYLNSRKENNKKYAEFWRDTSDKEFNKDKTLYVWACFTKIVD